ncbi:MAG: DUF493 domain-containing protein [Pseudomonadales bacterium]|nr:DUF493 domain-containing protein [Pseudomonadales bacterium]
MSKLISNKNLAPGEQAATIEFPCAYPIKVLGTASVEFEMLVIEVVEQHAPDFDASSITSRDSSKGSFRAVTLTINATGKPQLEALHTALMALDAVKMVL